MSKENVSPWKETIAILEELGYPEGEIDKVRAGKPIADESMLELGEGKLVIYYCCDCGIYHKRLEYLTIEVNILGVLEAVTWVADPDDSAEPADSVRIRTVDEYNKVFEDFYAPNYGYRNYLLQVVRTGDDYLDFLVPKYKETKERWQFDFGVSILTPKYGVQIRGARRVGTWGDFIQYDELPKYVKDYLSPVERVDHRYHLPAFKSREELYEQANGIKWQQGPWLRGKAWLTNKERADVRQQALQVLQQDRRK